MMKKPSAPFLLLAMMTLGACATSPVQKQINQAEESNLGQSKAKIEQAENDGARRLTPQSYAAAKADYQTATRAIQVHVNEPAAYQGAVAQSMQSSEALAQVLSIVNSMKVPEPAAMQVYQERQSSQTAQDKLRSDQMQNQAQLDALKNTNQKYASQEALNQKIASIRQQFSPDEADVFRDSGKLIVRLKSMQFNTARSEVKPSSYATLQKVKELIEALPADNVIVEGNTDSTGSAATNQKLSEQRADAVKQYLLSENAVSSSQIQAIGNGFEKPLASNKTAEGRAQNRRVDVVIESSALTG